MKHFVEAVGDIDYQSICLQHGERFAQTRLDCGDSPATVAKKIRQTKRFFQLAVERHQLDENPLRHLRQPKTTKQLIRILSTDECERILKVARDYQSGSGLRWDMLISVALITGMRNSEMLNAVWTNIDFDAKAIEVSPKASTNETWEWRIEDTDRRTLPVTEEVLSVLAEIQSQQPEKHPYVFVPPRRYARIQQLRRQGGWSFADARLKVINNFTRDFDEIQARASVDKARFHDLRNTALTNWFAMGLREYEVMRLAGHAKFETTHKFYLAVADDLVDRARAASSKGFGKNLARIWHAPLSLSQNEKGWQT